MSLYLPEADLARAGVVARLREHLGGSDASAGAVLRDAAAIGVAWETLARAYLALRAVGRVTVALEVLEALAVVLLGPATDGDREARLGKAEAAARALVGLPPLWRVLGDVCDAILAGDGGALDGA